MNEQLEIFLDMDEVIYNLTEYVVNQYNQDFKDNMLPSDNKSYWWADCKKANKSYFQDLLLQKGVFYNGNPVKNSIEIITKLHKEGFKIKIITLPQYNSKYCIQEKTLWIKKYLPFINVEKDLIFTGNKSLLSKKNRILIDDNISHLSNWNGKGGTAIAFTHPWNDNWGILKASNWLELYNLIQQLQNNLIKNNINNGIDLHNLKFYYENILDKGE